MGLIYKSMKERVPFFFIPFSVISLILINSFSFFHFQPHFCLNRPFGFSIHRGTNSFHCPIFAWIAFIGCQSAGCSFLPKPPFRVFNLASFSFVFFQFFIFILFFHSCHWPQIILGSNLLATCIEIDIDTHLFMHVSLKCTLLLRFAFKIDRKRFFQFSKMFVSDIDIIK